MAGKAKPKAKTANAKLPIIFILDMDQTLIGQSSTYGSCIDLVKFVRECCKSKKIESTSCPKAITYADMVKPDFFRVGLKDMLTGIREMYPTAELFVYSAGAKLYVESMIPVIEKHVGMTFNRPLFTRDDCVVNESNNYTKSIMVHIDTMLRSLAHKYPKLDAQKDTMLQSRIVFVDDVDIVWDIKEKWVKCPEYGYTPVVDLTHHIADMAIRRHPLVTAHIEKNRQFFKEPEGVTSDERDMAYHLYMADWHRSQYMKNKAALEDGFCKAFVTAIKPFKKLAHPFSNANIGKINASLNGPQVTK